MFRAALLALLAVLGPVPSLRAEPPQDFIQRLKPAIVNIQVSVSQGLAGDESGSWYGTGFIVDAKNGLIVTNRHVASRGPAQYKIGFFDGESTTQATLVYVDSWHDFAFLKISTPSVKTPLQAVELGNSFQLKPQDKVVLIGNNEAQEYTVLRGEVINTEVNAGDRHSGDFQFVMGTRGGSSGGPVLNEKGQAVGLNYKGTDVTGFAMRIEYVKDALKKLLICPLTCKRGDPGYALDLMPISDARKNFHLPDDVARRIGASGDARKMIYVQGVIPGGPAVGKLEPGDLVLDVDGTAVGSNLYKADTLIDARTGQKALLRVMRNGVELKVGVDVRDADAEALHAFAQFAGGVVHDVTPELRREYNIDTPGVFLSQTEQGSSLSTLGTAPKGEPKNRTILITAVNGLPTPDLPSFIRVAGALKDGDDINVTVRDFMLPSTAPKAEPVSLDLKFHPLRYFQYSDATHKWSEAPAPTGTN